MYVNSIIYTYPWSQRAWIHRYTMCVPHVCAPCVCPMCVPHVRAPCAMCMDEVHVNVLHVCASYTTYCKHLPSNRYFLRECPSLHRLMNRHIVYADICSRCSSNAALFSTTGCCLITG